MTKSDLKIVFFGAPYFSAEILKSLLNGGFSVDAVVTHPDQPVGRKKKLTPTDVKLLAKSKNIPVREFALLNETAYKICQELKPDLFVVASYGLIIPEKFLTIPTLGSLNVHPSLLPKLRGATPIQTALQQGLKITGSSIILMDAGMDSGNIIRQEKLDIGTKDTYPILEKKLLKISKRLLVDVLRTIEKTGRAPKGINQNHSQATFTRMLSKKDGLVNWRETAETIYNKWRAFYNWPETYTFYKKQKLILKEISPVKLATKNPLQEGSVFQLNKKRGEIFVQTGKGILQIDKLQLAGKKILSAKDFLNGQADFIGSVLGED